LPIYNGGHGTRSWFASTLFNLNASGAFAEGVGGALPHTNMQQLHLHSHCTRTCMRLGVASVGSTVLSWQGARLDLVYVTHTRTGVRACEEAGACTVVPCYSAWCLLLCTTINSLRPRKDVTDELRREQITSENLSSASWRTRVRVDPLQAKLLVAPPPPRYASFGASALTQYGTPPRCENLSQARTAKYSPTELHIIHSR
jgi:hypothetical protein